jgi:taurine dioxygenase
MVKGVILMTTTVTTTPFSAALGVEIDGIDAAAASPSDIETVREQLVEHLVVVLPGQHLTAEQHEAFMANFGPLHFHPFLELMGEAPSYTQRIEQTMESPAGVDHWHTDLVFAPEPVAFGSLYCETAPSFGGGTEFANLYLAYEQLDHRWRALIEQVECQYQLSPHMLDNFARFYGDEARQVWIDALAGTIHPLVRTHPESGRNSVFFSPNTEPTVLGMSKAESDAILTMLTSHCTRPNITARWRWSAGDLVIWDERCTLHYGVRDGYPGERNMRRVLVNGDRPVFSPQR